MPADALVSISRHSIDPQSLSPASEELVVSTIDITTQKQLRHAIDHL